MILLYVFYTILFFLINSFFLNFLKKKNIYDLPGEFKSHKFKIPKGSGLGVSLLIICGLITFYLNYQEDFNIYKIPRFYSFIIGFLFLFIVSFYDDYIGINPFIRLFIQITICFLCLSSLPLNLWSYMNGYITFSKLNWLIIIYIWLFIINLTNFYDGVDFIITLKTFFVSILYLFLGYYSNDNIVINLSIILILSSILLSYFNIHPAKFFLGDSGSIPLGFILGWLFIYLFQKGYIIECLIINLPHFIDIIYVELKKLTKLENIFIRHRDFIFQKKYDLELNKKKYYIKYIYIYLLLVIIGLISFFSNIEFKIICLLLAIISTSLFLNANKQ